MQIPRWLQITAGFVGMAIVSVAVKNLFGQGPSYRAPGDRDNRPFIASRDTQPALRLLKAELDKKIPMKVDDISTLVGFDVGVRQVHYRFRIAHPYSDDLADRFQNAMPPILRQAYCKRKELEVYRRLNVKAQYSYKTQDNQSLADITVQRSDC
jgi:hypothetical protein